ncbi:MAG TPA: DUF4116 domain-containing protein [Rhabdochlamydiaceae bacterium]|nr:DUF4116 domain-containing protein [Rhabdochlamydiaceae bacterium]
MESIRNFLIKADNICDYVPFLSTITNLIDIFQKAVIIPSMKKSTTVSSRYYYTHLNEKNFSRCIALLVPILGNIIVAIYDFVNSLQQITPKKSKALALKANIANSRPEAGPQRVNNAGLHGTADSSQSPQITPKITPKKSEARKANTANSRPEAVPQRVENGYTTQEIAQVLRIHQHIRAVNYPQYVDENLALAAIKQDDFVLSFANEKLKKNKKVVLASVKQCGLNLKDASKELQNDKEVVLAAVKANSHAFEYASKKLKGDKEFVLDIIQQDASAFQFANVELRNDKNFARAAMQKDTREFSAVYFCLTDELREDEELRELYYHKKQRKKSTN